MSGRKDYRVTVKVRNNKILTAAERVGLSIPKVAKAAGVSYPALNDLVNMTASPFTRDGKVRPLVDDVCAALGVPFDELFSDAQREALTTNKSEVEVDAEQVYLLMGQHATHQQIEHDDGLGCALLEAVETLTEMEQEVINSRFGIDGPEQSRQQIADRFGVSMERIRQLEQRAMRKLRHPSRSGVLRDFVGELA
jgi:DNA-binding CsgD family transcriptional regulator